MRIFISSVISGFEAYRDAAAEAAETLGHEVVRAEDFGARSTTPRRACLHEVRAADLMLLIMGEKYGGKLPSGLSATHEEFNAARDAKSILVFVQDHGTREPSQREFESVVSGWAAGRLFAKFGDPASLKKAVTKAVHNFEIERERLPVDPDRVLRRALKGITETKPDEREPCLALVVAGAPEQTILRPAKLEAQTLSDEVFARMIVGPDALFDRRRGTNTNVKENELVIEQADRSSLVAVHADGTVRLFMPLSRGEKGLRAQLPMAVIEEEVSDALRRLLGAAAWLLDQIDPDHRMDVVVPTASLTGCRYHEWRTAAKQSANPNSYRLAQGDQGPVNLSPPSRPRSSLRESQQELIEDFLVLLRRNHR